MNLKNKHVLVTGADGFIGSHLVEILLREGCVVRAFVYYNAFNSWGWLDSLDKNQLKKIEIFQGDVRDQSMVREAMKGSELVFHLAALIGIPFSYHSPESYIDTNVKGTLHVLQAAREFNAEKILITSTSEVYGTARRVPITEDHVLQGQSPYSASKIGADKISESFFLSFGLPVSIVRPFNTYGPRQSARAIIPTIIIQLLNGKKTIRLGSLDPTRDFNYVKDVCRGFVDIAKSDKTAGEVVNIASGSEVSIGELAKMISKKINPEARVILDKQRMRPRGSEVLRLLGSNKKICQLAGWTPRYSIDEGLNETIKWFRKNTKFYKSDIYNV